MTTIQSFSTAMPDPTDAKLAKTAKTITKTGVKVTKISGHSVSALNQKKVAKIVQQMVTKIFWMIRKVLAACSRLVLSIQAPMTGQIQWRI
jgi:hypothetical protein